MIGSKGGIDMWGKYRSKILFVLSVFIGLILFNIEPIEYTFKVDAAPVYTSPTAIANHDVTYKSYRISVEKVTGGTCSASILDFVEPGNRTIPDNVIKSTIKGSSGSTSVTIQGHIYVYVYNRGSKIDSGYGPVIADRYGWDPTSKNDMKGLATVIVPVTPVTTVPPPTGGQPTFPPIPTGHIHWFNSFEREIQDSTCTEPGITEIVYYCSCGATYYDYDYNRPGPKGHIYGRPEELAGQGDATSDSPGFRYYEEKCLRRNWDGICQFVTDSRTFWFYAPTSQIVVFPKKFIQDTYLDTNRKYVKDNSYVKPMNGRVDTIVRREWTISDPDSDEDQQAATYPHFKLDKISKVVNDYQLLLDTWTMPEPAYGYEVQSTNWDNFQSFTVGPKTNIKDIDIKIYNDGKVNSKDKLSVSNVTVESTFVPNSVRLDVMQNGANIKSYTLTRTGSSGVIGIISNWTDVVNNDLSINLSHSANCILRVTVYMNDGLGEAKNSTFNIPIIAQDTRVLRKPGDQNISNEVGVVDKGQNIELISDNSLKPECVTAKADMSIFEVGGSNQSQVTLAGAGNSLSKIVKLASIGGDYGSEIDNNVLTFTSTNPISQDSNGDGVIDTKGECTNIEENRIKPNWYFDVDLTVKAVRDLAWKDEYTRDPKTTWATDKIGYYKLPVQYKPSPDNQNATIKLGYGLDFALGTVKLVPNSQTRLFITTKYYDDGVDVTDTLRDNTLGTRPVVKNKYGTITIYGNDNSANTDPSGIKDIFSKKVTVGAGANNPRTWSFMYYLPSKVLNNDANVQGTLKVQFSSIVLEKNVGGTWTPVFNYNNIAALNHSGWNGDAFIYNADKSLLEDISAGTTH